MHYSLVKNKEGLLKGAGQGAIEGLLAIGTVVTAVALFTSKK
nr:MAG TPA: hypothetical protein [Caudoviricetes sp.]